MAVNIGINIQRSANRIAQAVRESGVGGKYPDLLLDFDDAYYRANGGSKPLSEVVTHSRSGNATMVDSDGLLKWAPHNLLSYSEDLQQSPWEEVRATLTPNQTAPDGSTTAYLLEQDSGETDHGIANQSFDTPANTAFSVWAKKQNKDFVIIYTSNQSSGDKTWFNLNNGTVGTTDSNHTATIESAGSGWYKCTVVSSVSGNRNGFYLADTDGSTTVTDSGGVYLWRPHTYRSDLGGMAPVPAGERVIPSASTYVPTTSAARYLPRVGHHVYNGSAWVNEGVLVESEARTNLLTYSSEFDNADWTKSGATITANTAVSPDGTLTGDKLVPSTSSSVHYVGQNISFISGNSYTASVFAKAGGYVYARLFVYAAVAGVNTNVYFDLSSGTVATENGNVVSSSIVNVGNGWYRCSMTVTATASTSDAVNVHAIETDDTPIYTGDGTSGVYFYGAQVEAGSTPSSYIPTAGATVTRAAETLTIPAANLPWPAETYGPELVTNGTFDSDTSGWTAVNAVLSVSSNALSVADNGRFSAAYQAVTTEVGRAYRLSLDCVSKTGGEFAYGWGDAIPDGDTNYASQEVIFQTVSGSYTLDFVAVSTTTYISVGSQSTDAAVYDNVSVRELTRYPVSIQTQGRVTYADENELVAGELLKWQQDADNYISYVLSTSVLFTGVVFVTQSEGGTADSVATEDYTPGILVPFNIASRHGMTFINGAVDGVALTADTTPTNLPDLSATDLDLAYTFMGTVERFRVWGVDLGDDGIAEASA